MSNLICPECGAKYPPGTLICLVDAYEFVDEPALVQVETEEDLQLPDSIDAQLMVLGDDQVGPRVHIEVLHIDGTDFTAGTYIQSFPVRVLQRGELRIGKRTMRGMPPYRPEVDFYDLLKTYGQSAPWPISRLQATMLLEQGALAIRHKPEQSSTWIRHSGSNEHVPIPPNRVAKLEQRDVITFGKPRRRYVRFRVYWDR